MKIIFKITILLLLVTNAFATDVNLVISASHTKEKQNLLPSNIEIIDEEMLKKQNISTLNDTIKNVLGITDISYRGSIGNEESIRIRGQQSKYTYVLLDGQPLNDLSLDIADISSIPIEYIERIEIIKGPSSAIYGANGCAGTINIITKTPKDDFSSEYKFSISDFSTIKNSLSSNINKNVFFNFEQNHSDGFREHNEYDNNIFLTRYTKDFDKNNRLNFRLLYTLSELEVCGQNSTKIEDYDGSTEKQASSPYATQNDEKIYFQSSYEHSFDDELALTTEIYLTNTNRRYTDPTLFQDKDTNHNNNVVSIKTKFTNSHSAIGVETAWKNYTQTDKTQNNLELQDHFYLDKSLFFEHKVIANNSNAIFSVRCDNNSLFGTFINPKISLVNNISSSTKISAAIAKGVKFPTFSDLYSPYSSWTASIWSTAGDTQGNQDLKPETSLGIDLGIEQNLKISDITSTIKINYFKTRFNDLISWKDISTTSTYQKWRPINIGEAINEGFEVGIINNIFQNIITQTINYTYLENTGKENSNEYKLLDYSPYNTVSHNIEYMYFNNSYICFTSKFIDEQKASGSTLDSYITHDFNISFSIADYSIFFGIENIFDEKYQNRLNYPLPGRVLKGGISIKF